MKNNTINLVPSGHEVGIVTMVSGEILASFFIDLIDGNLLISPRKCL